MVTHRLRSQLIDQRETAPSHRLVERILKKIVTHRGVLPRYLFQYNIKRTERNPIAGGGFADVWRGELRGKTVALKVLRTFEYNSNGFKDKNQHEICKEAMIWRQFDHPNVLPFYGICIEEFSPRMAMVSPWMNNEGLMKYLTKHPNIDRIAMVRKYFVLANDC